MCTKAFLIFATAALLLQTAQAFYCNSCSALEFEAKVLLKRENELLRQRKRAENLAAYNYNINITEPNRQAMVNIATANARANKLLALKLKSRPYGQIQNETICRQLKKLSRRTFDVLPANEFQQLSNAITAMQINYATATVCAWNGQPVNDDDDDSSVVENTNSTTCNLTLEPFVNERLRNSRNPDELAHYWRAWYDAAGTPSRNNFKTYVKLSRKAARLNNFPSYAEDWLSYYEDANFEQTLDAAFKKLVPFYAELHAFVRHRLREFYGEDVVSATGNIPMHLLGNMWGQQWDGILDLITPFPNVSVVNVTGAVLNQGLTVRQLVALGDDFFKSLGMRELPASFWNLSILERPADRPIVCHASAWDFYQDSDVRIKMCAQLNAHYLTVILHELGHTQYYLQYEKQPTVFRSAAAPGLHEAFGDTVALAATAPKNLFRLGLLPSPTLSEQTRINELFKAAVQKVVLVPYAYALDKFRLAVFRGELDETVWNCAFWQMRSEFTGVEPPFVRTDLDFDPTAKYHVAADVEYLRYLASRIFQLQFLKAICLKAGQYDPADPNKPLDNCDVYNNKDVGLALSQFLSLGSSKHWQEALFQLTGESNLDPTALLEYFAPLYKWLRDENRRLGVPIGWDATEKVAPGCCPPFST